MNRIDHLNREEQQHYILCDCGEYLDMRNLSEVFSHMHNEKIPEPNWSFAIKKGEPVAYLRNGEKIDLN